MSSIHSIWPIYGILSSPVSLADFLRRVIASNVGSDRRRFYLVLFFSTKLLIVFSTAFQLFSVDRLPPDPPSQSLCLILPVWALCLLAQIETFCQISHVCVFSLIYLFIFFCIGSLAARQELKEMVPWRCGPFKIVFSWATVTLLTV